MKEWRVSYDLGHLIAGFKKQKMPFAVWMVPGLVHAEYEIKMFAPVVSGAVWLTNYS